MFVQAPVGVMRTLGSWPLGLTHASHSPLCDISNSLGRSTLLGCYSSDLVMGMNI